jgi:hypothetical protein
MQHAAKERRQRMLVMKLAALNAEITALLALSSCLLTTTKEQRTQLSVNEYGSVVQNGIMIAAFITPRERSMTNVARYFLTTQLFHFRKK